LGILLLRLEPAVPAGGVDLDPIDFAAARDYRWHIGF
jgi:hypothetical protein